MCGRFRRRFPPKSGIKTLPGECISPSPGLPAATPSASLPWGRQSVDRVAAPMARAVAGTATPHSPGLGGALRAAPSPGDAPGGDSLQPGVMTPGPEGLPARVVSPVDRRPTSGLPLRAGQLPQDWPKLQLQFPAGDGATKFRDPPSPTGLAGSGGGCLHHPGAGGAGEHLGGGGMTAAVSPLRSHRCRGPRPVRARRATT